MVAKKSTALSVIAEAFPVLMGGGAEETMLAISENIGNDVLTPWSLPRLKVPGGGARSWEIEILGEVDSVQAIRGVMLHTTINRSYWKENFDSSGGGSPPDCVSQDGLNGVGEPGGDCLSCRFNQFGSDTGPDGTQAKGKACKEQRVIYILQENDVFPSILVTPPTSLNPAKKYLLDLGRAGRSLGCEAPGRTYDQVVTEFTLKKEDRSGYPTSVINFALAKDSAGNRMILSADEVAHVRALSALLENVFTQFQAEATAPGDNLAQGLEDKLEDDI